MSGTSKLIMTGKQIVHIKYRIVYIVYKEHGACHPSLFITFSLSIANILILKDSVESNVAFHCIVHNTHIENKIIRIYKKIRNYSL